MYQRKASIRTCGHGDHVVVEKVQDVALRLIGAAIARRGEPALFLLDQIEFEGIAERPDLPAVGFIGSVVNNDDLEVARGQCLLAERGERVAQRAGAVVRGDDDAEFHSVRGRF